MKRFVLVLVTSLGLLLSTLTPLNAITFGKEITSASISYPSVVSVWIREDAEATAQFICTGTLIEPRVVLTAAHCVLDKNYLYYIKYGNDLLNEDTPLLEVASTWRDPRYSQKQKVNDVGLLLLTQEIVGAKTTNLPSTQEIKKILAAKGTKLEVVGWGKDQNSEQATYIRRALVDDQSPKLKKYKDWRNDVWIAVGKFNAKEKVYAGSCNGDSGGPLFALSGSKQVLVGVTSWGAEDCEIGFPSIYVRLSYYIAKLKSEGMDTLYQNETKQNRAMPSSLTDPEIIGIPQTNGIVECNPGTWSSNVIKLETIWSTDQYWTFPDASVARLSLPKEFPTDTKLTCTVTAASNNGQLTKSVSVTLPGKPIYNGYLSISGVSSYTVPKVGTVASCTGITWQKQPQTISYTWYGGDEFTDAAAISRTQNLTLTSELIKKYAGKTISCAVFASNLGGYAIATAIVGLSALSKPSAPSLVMTYFSSYDQIRVGTTINCAATPYSYGTDYDSVSYRWGYTKKYSYSSTPDAYLGFGANLVVTQEVLALISDKDLYCYATLSNLAGDSIFSTYRSVAKQDLPTPSASPTPTPSASPTPTPSASPTPTPSASPTPTPTPTPTRATLQNPVILDFTPARYTSTNAPEALFSYVVTSKSLGSSPCSNPCSGLVAGETVTITRRIQSATNPESVTFYVDNASRAPTDILVGTLTSGTFLDGIWGANWVVSQTITDNVWHVKTQLKWGTEWSDSGG